MVEVSLEKLVETGAHFGHQVRRWNPRMKPYLYGEEGGVHIFDLIKTKKCLDEALEVLRKASKEGRKILIVGTKKQAKDKVKEIAIESGTFYVNERWLGGTLTNFEQLKLSTQKLIDMEKKYAEGYYNKYTKKERLLTEREIARLNRFFAGVKNMPSTPDLIVIIDTKKEKGAVKEALNRGVETIGIIDSNSDPDDVDWPIPMNDDATKAIEYVLDLFKYAILDGKGAKSSTDNTGKISKPEKADKSITASKNKVTSAKKSK